MPESRVRRKKKDAPAVEANSPAAVNFDSPRWLAPAMVTFFLLGLLWIVIFYLAGTSFPVMKDLNNLANVGIGFGLLGIGFVLATRWK